MKSILSLASLLLAAPALVRSVTVPGADTPSFYLVSSSTKEDANLLPVRTEGGAGGYATLSGDGAIGVFYFMQGKLTAAPRTPTGNPLRPGIGALLTGRGCTTYGSLGFSDGGSTNKCTIYDTFSIQSNSENSQLGAKLAFNNVGSFYTCGSNNDLWYKVSPNDGQSGCTPVDLYTVPVV